MKAALLVKPFQIEIKDVKEPKVGREDLLIKIKSVGICGSDNHMYRKAELGKVKINLPFILGHEGSGEVVEIGADVKDFKIGDRVAIEPATICGRCEFCLSGRYNLCDYYKSLTLPPDNNGCLCEFISHNYNHAFKLPETISFEEGALVEPLSVVLQAYEISNFRIGDSVLIIGSGSIGMLTLILVKALGANKCFVADVNEFKLETAKDLGADFTINITKTDIVDFINCNTLGKGVPVIFDYVGQDTSLNKCISVAKKNATIVIIGISEEKASFDIVQLINKMLIIKGTSDFVNAFPKSISLIRNKIVDVKAIMTNFFNFEDTDEAFKNLQTNLKTIKTIIKLN